MQFFILGVLEDAVTSIINEGCGDKQNDFHEKAIQYLEANVFAKPLPNLPKNVAVQETISKPSCFTEVEPRMKHSISDILVDTNWIKNISFLDANAIAKVDQKNLGYKDR